MSDSLSHLDPAMVDRFNADLLAARIHALEVMRSVMFGERPVATAAPDESSDERSRLARLAAFNVLRTPFLKVPGCEVPEPSPPKSTSSPTPRAPTPPKAPKTSPTTPHDPAPASDVPVPASSKSQIPSPKSHLPPKPAQSRLQSCGQPTSSNPLKPHGATPPRDEAGGAPDLPFTVTAPIMIAAISRVASG